MARTRTAMPLLTTPEAPGTTTSRLNPELERLFHEHSGMLYRTAYGMLGNHADAEDVLQTLFLRLLQANLPQALFRNPAGYLYRAAVNASINVIRSRKRFVSAGPELLDVALDEEHSRNAEDLHRRLMEAIAGLNQKDIHVLVLRYVHGRSDAQIAEVLGVSRGSIAMRLFRSRLRLRKFIGEKP
jgi:RNA polymerase sigma-70 factor (ECF subfamily)